MVPDRHGATAWKRWISCLTDHLDFENLENRRRYQNPGKPRTAGLSGREVVASDHLPLSSTFFGWPKPPDLTHKTAAAVPLPMLFSSGDTLAKRPRQPPPTRAAHGSRPPQRPRVLPSPPKPHTAPHRWQRLALAQGPDTRSQALYALPQESAIFFTAAQMTNFPLKGMQTRSESFRFNFLSAFSSHQILPNTFLSTKFFS